MSKAIILQHVPHEGAGRILPALRDFGIPVEIRKLHAGDEVPTKLDEVRVLVVMGGPMGVNETDVTRFPFLGAEIGLLKQVIDADLPFLGICLGAQLMAFASGAKVFPNVSMARTKPGEAAQPAEPIAPLPEIGWGPVNLPFPGGNEPVVAGLRDGVMMFHWHFDTFDLPRLPASATPQGPPPPPTGNVLIASTRFCRNQAYRFKNRIFGFQFHFEMDREGIEAMIEHAREDWRKVLGADGDARIRRDTEQYYPEYERVGNRLIDNFVQTLRLH
jgi:GMP synthase (glutamine-hydrolysing)